MRDSSYRPRWLRISARRSSSRPQASSPPTGPGWRSRGSPTNSPVGRPGSGSAKGSWRRRRCDGGCSAWSGAWRARLAGSRSTGHVP